LLISSCVLMKTIYPEIARYVNFGLLLAAVFCEDFFERNRFHGPQVVGSNAIFDFLSPQSIDCFVRLIEAGKKLVNHQGFVGSGETHCSVNDFLGFCPHVSDHNKQLNIGLCKRLSPA